MILQADVFNSVVVAITCNKY